MQEEYKRIQKYAASWNKIGNYAMCTDEMNAFLTCSPDIWNAITLAFRFGFEKGYRKAKKAVKSA